jgi:hypothetical protein
MRKALRISVSGATLDELIRRSRRSGLPPQVHALRILEGREPALATRLTDGVSQPMRWWREVLDAGCVGFSWPATITTAALYSHYVGWCAAQGEDPAVAKVPLARNVLRPWLGPRSYAGGLWARSLMPLDDARKTFDGLVGPVIELRKTASEPRDEVETLGSPAAPTEHDRLIDQARSDVILLLEDEQEIHTFSELVEETGAATDVVRAALDRLLAQELIVEREGAYRWAATDATDRST